MEKYSKGPINTLEALARLPEKNPLRILSMVVLAYPIERFNLRDHNTYPRLPLREWTDEELRSIGQWLQEYDLEIQSAVATLHELDQSEEAFKLTVIGSYFSLIEGQIHEQKGILSWKEVNAKADLLSAVQDPHAQALAAMQFRNPGEA